MGTLENLAGKAIELKSKGLNEHEIASELHLSRTTVEWLLGRGFTKNEGPKDVKIGWKSIAVYPRRIGNIAEIMADIVAEELDIGKVDSVVGIPNTGLPLATLTAEILSAELIIYNRPRNDGNDGTFSPAYASVDGKNVIIIDDVINTGSTLKSAIKNIKKNGGNPLLTVVLVNKTPNDDVDGVRLRGIIRALSI